jgi:hypothetical protein
VGIQHRDFRIELVSNLNRLFQGDESSFLQIGRTKNMFEHAAPPFCRGDVISINNCISRPTISTKSKIKTVTVSIPVRYLWPSFMVAWPPG